MRVREKDDEEWGPSPRYISTNSRPTTESNFAGKNAESEYSWPDRLCTVHQTNQTNQLVVAAGGACDRLLVCLRRPTAERKGSGPDRVCTVHQTNRTNQIAVASGGARDKLLICFREQQPNVNVLEVHGPIVPHLRLLVPLAATFHLQGTGGMI